MLKHSLLANYLGQFVTVVLGIVMVPIYVRHLGVEAYGLIAFNAVLLAWVQVLDLGLSPTLCREFATLRRGVSREDVRLLLQSLEKFVAVICIVLIFLSMAGAPLFARDWMNAKALPVREIETAFLLMVMTVSARWFSSLYRGGLVGIDRQQALNAVIIVFAIVRTVLVVPFIEKWPSIEILFLWQLVASIAEALTMRVLLGRTIDAPILTLAFSRAILTARARLSLSIAFSALVWASTTQIDKLLLSKLLPLPAFGAFGMATLLASGILLLAGPIQQAFIPRFTSEGATDCRKVISSYFLATEITMIAVIPVAVIFASTPEAVFRLWSASVPSTPDTWCILRCYAIGNACLAIGGLSYLVQFAKGDLSLHIKGTLGFLIVLIPVMAYGAFYDGARGVAYAWLALNALQMVIWVGVVHRKFMPGINRDWYRGLAIRVALAGLLGFAFHYADLTRYSRLEIFLILSGLWVAIVALVVAFSPILQRKARQLAGRFVFN